MVIPQRLNLMESDFSILSPQPLPVIPSASPHQAVYPFEVPLDIREFGGK